jgi:alkylated DNA repair protein alkB family protein 8
MSPEYAEYLLNKTREDYNRIAEQFSRSREFIWEELSYLTRYVNDGDKILDIGCGNGRLLQIFKNKKIDYTGIDSSEKLIEIAKEKIRNSKFEIRNSATFRVADALNLPFKDDSFDKVFSIAVLHHIPSEELRLKFLKETKRILKPKGFLVLTAWYFWHEWHAWWFLIKSFIPKLFGLSKLDFKDIWESWKRMGINRYYHCFTKKELKNLAEKAGFAVREIGILQKARRRNIYLIIEKTR